MANNSIKALVLLRHRKSMSQYLMDKRDKTYHVTDFVYGCPRYAKWVYEIRQSEPEDELRPLSERDMTVFTIGKKLDELPVGDYHHVKLRKVIGGLEIVGEIDDLIIMNNIAIVVDKKHIRGKPPKDAHSHYVAQVNTYAYFLKSGCEIVSIEYANDGATPAVLNKLLKNVTKYYGAVLYIDVSLETNTVSDVVDWEIDPKDFATIEENLEKMVELIQKAGDKPAEPKVSWFCNYCPFIRRCAEVGLG